MKMSPSGMMDHANQEAAGGLSRNAETGQNTCVAISQTFARVRSARLKRESFVFRLRLCCSKQTVRLRSLHWQHFRCGDMNE